MNNIDIITSRLLLIFPENLQRYSWLQTGDAKQTKLQTCNTKKTTSHNVHLVNASYKQTISTAKMYINNKKTIENYVSLYELLLYTPLLSTDTVLTTTRCA